MKILRRKSRIIKIGNIHIGGRRPVAIQSMAKTKTAEIDSTLNQIKSLRDAGCEIVRLAVKDDADARALKEIKRKAKLPIVADIHFDWRFAIQAIESGVDKIRLNPGNIYKINEVSKIARAARYARIPLRVGVNSGSLLGRKVRKSEGRQGQADKMVKSALDYIKILEGLKFYDIVVSLKGSNIFETMEAYRKISGLCDYPLHLGVTATGPSYSGVIKSSIAIGALLMEGIGDTIRVSLTDKPEQEVKAARCILEAVGLRSFGPEIISCPTCGRCEVDLVEIVNNLEKKLLGTKDYGLRTKPLRVAVMGCVVNGPGEAAQADIGVAFGRRKAVIFGKGKVLGTSNEKNIIRDLMRKVR